MSWMSWSFWRSQKSICVSTMLPKMGLGHGTGHGSDFRRRPGASSPGTRRRLRLRTSAGSAAPRPTPGSQLPGPTSLCAARFFRVAGTMTEADVSYSVFEEIAPEIIYLDAHPYALLKNVIAAFLTCSKEHTAILAIHDCGPGLFNRRMTLSKSGPATAIPSNTGVWERHVLADLFLSHGEIPDDCSTAQHRLKIFQTPHGLALIAPHHLFAQGPSKQAHR